MEGGGFCFDKRFSDNQYVRAVYRADDGNRRLLLSADAKHERLFFRQSQIRRVGYVAEC